ncbi:putative leucine-rich repeat-containing protein DDB_G0281931 [Actinia tenebrosa]|uniref:Leucine-rich repeat-containing protein DDB_G0281931 n=1 Tax=Actinia tenebrosa TaxID=6105 RepID=A0A6P8IB42_ACTTE|nr:putative leucine-rich repeat-containing protein DDB_G0281931 [Actinia tenebrosa]
MTSYSLGIPKAYECPVAEACKGGLDSECSLGYEGPLCAVCSKGFYMLASTCRKCPSLPWIIAQVVLITVIITGLLIFMIKEKKSKSNKRSLSDAMTARLKIVIGFFQVTSGTISGFSFIKWPDVMISAIKYAELLQMNLLQIAPPQCLTRSLKTDIHVKLMLILVFNSTVVFLGLLYYYIKTRSNSRNGEVDDNIKCSAQQQCFRAIFLILFISYPLTSSHIFMVLPEACQKICTSTEDNSCSYYLKSDYTVRCESQRFFWFSIFARVLLVYPVGFPLLVLYLLWKHYYKKTDPTKRRKEALGIALGLRFMYENYAEQVWFWEIIELVRKVILTSVILLLDAGSRFTIGITAIISGSYSISFAYFKPMTDVFEHWLQLTSLLATLVNMIVGTLLVTQNEGSSATGEALDGAVIKVLLIGANAAVVAIMAARYLTTLGQTFLAIRRNPRCSLSCCLFLVLTLNEASNEMAGVDTSGKGLKRQQNLQNNFGEPQLDLSQAGLSVELEKK